MEKANLASLERHSLQNSKNLKRSSELKIIIQDVDHLDETCPSPTSSLASPTQILSSTTNYNVTNMCGNVYFEAWQGTDAILEVESTKLHVHSQILALASPVFARMFDFEDNNTSKVVHISNHSVLGMVCMLNLIYPTEYKITEHTDYQELLRIAKKFDIRRILNLIDDYLSLYSSQNTASLKLAEEYKLHRTKEAAIRALTLSKDKSIFNSHKYRSLKASSKLKILQGKLKFALASCEDMWEAEAYPNCQHGFRVHPPFSFKGNTDDICCRKEGSYEVLNRLKKGEFASLKALLD